MRKVTTMKTLLNSTWDQIGYQDDGHLVHTDKRTGSSAHALYGTELVAYPTASRALWLRPGRLWSVQKLLPAFWLQLCRKKGHIALFRVFYFESRKTTGGSNAKVHRDFDCGGTRAGNDGPDGQCSRAAARSRQHPRTQERNTDCPTGGM
jgi:hypothetical protein